MKEEKRKKEERGSLIDRDLEVRARVPQTLTVQRGAPRAGKKKTPKPPIFFSVIGYQIARRDEAKGPYEAKRKERGSEESSRRQKETTTRERRQKRNKNKRPL
jgi:hypothetical protein